MDTNHVIRELRRHGLHAVAQHVKEMQAEIAELRATSKLQGALISVAARVVAQAA